ncbi:hypothetical protein, partial [Streptomyces sp. bgisy031]|uniref:hypothetical protein n=1 Tax=Streptomyces sp. bgisy031 TaxID=3413772 RepID=UPI003D73478C
MRFGLRAGVHRPGPARTWGLRRGPGAFRWDQAERPNQGVGAGAVHRKATDDNAARRGPGTREPGMIRTTGPRA